MVIGFNARQRIQSNGKGHPLVGFSSQGAIFNPVVFTIYLYPKVVFAFIRVAETFYYTI